MMTKKDFELIASILRYYTNRAKAHIETQDEQAIIASLVTDFCVELEKENPRFDSEKFYQAVGV